LYTYYLILPLGTVKVLHAYLATLSSKVGYYEEQKTLCAFVYLPAVSSRVGYYEEQRTWCAFVYQPAVSTVVG
jgi:hypothetical protein